MSNTEFTISDNFWRKLEEKYNLLSGGSKEWKQEKPSFERLIPLIQKEISPRYNISEELLGVGGISIVLKIKDTNLCVYSALKFPRPKVGKEILFAEIIESEISHLLKVRHSNIIEIYFQGEVVFDKKIVPFYIMECIPGAEDALEYFSKEPRDGRDIFQVIKQLADGINHLHEMNIIHGDIKLENMLISSDGRVVISDLGSARNLSEGSEKIPFIFTREFAHPELISLITYLSSSDPNRIRVEIERSKLKKSFDLYALGKNIRRILNFHEPEKWKGLDFYSRKYLDMMTCRLLDGRNASNECALGLSRDAFDELKYRNISQVVIDIKKITGEYPLNQFVPEMNIFGVQTIQTSSLSSTTFTPRLGQIITHPILRRLAGISQLGFISLVYPSATHSRLEHVLGTFSNTVRYCNALYNDPVNPLFKQIMNEDDLKTVLLTALLHDIAQYPLAHDLEEAEPEIFSHKEIAIGLLENTIQFLDISSLRKIINDSWGISLQRVADILKADPTDLKLPIKDRLLHTIIDGPIDADKLDYLVRDSVNLNLPFGKAIDFERLLQCLTVIFKAHGDKVYIALGIHEKGKIPAETVAFARYAMFGTVYWHHTSRAAKAMLHRAVWESLSIRTHAKALKTYRKDLYNFILRHREKQTKLFEEQRTTQHILTQLLPTDQQILAWLSERTTQAGVELIQMISDRKLYKRILVVSKRKNPHLWETLTKFSRKYDWHWQMIVNLQIEIQHRMIDKIRKIDPSIQRTTSALEPNTIDKIIALSEKGTILILIDIPSDRPGSTIPLEYLPEADRRDMLMEWKEPCPLEDSVIWTQLHESFLESVGKLRVFCHPDIRNTFEVAIKKNELEGIIEESVRYLQK